MKEFKVFYSWQSDLSGNKTRYFIQKCIDEAVDVCNGFVKSIEITADRDTQGLTGSPNISQSIFDKIDDCNLFIADVSLVNKYITVSEEDDDIDNACDTETSNSDDSKKDADNKEKQIKYTPNPNVLIELGYAVKHLGWNRVICLLNKDYGIEKELPFDLDHQRVTGYSIESEGKESAKKRIRSIIVETIIQLAKQPTNPKKGKAYHVVGTYNPETRQIDADLVAYDVYKNPWIEYYFEEHKDKAKNLINQISLMDLPIRTVKEEKHEKSPYDDIIENHRKLMGTFTDEDNWVNCDLPAMDIDTIKELAPKYLADSSVSLDDKFFNVGNLKIQRIGFHISPFGGDGLEKKGTEDEIKKYSLLEELVGELIDIQKLELYLKTFDDITLLPIAIENTSTDSDENLEINIAVEGAEVVYPDDNLINPEIRDAKTIIYENGYPMHLLMMIETADIKYENKMWYEPDEPFYGTALPGFPVAIKDEDYDSAIKMYVAEPISDSEYQFNIESLMANEKKWLEGLIALRNVKEGMKLTYRIRSKNTDGRIEGTLTYAGQSR